MNYVDDEFWGVGGRYMVGEDGKRFPVDENGQPLPAPAAEAQQGDEPAPAPETAGGEVVTDKPVKKAR